MNSRELTEAIANLDTKSLPCASCNASQMNTTSFRRPRTSPQPHCRTGRPVSSRGPPLVLIIDDCACLRALIKIILREMASVHAVTAATSEEALNLAQRRKFDAVTSDINRPGMNGLEFLGVFKPAHPSTPVIIISGVLDEARTRLANQAKWLRAFACLPKPFACGELVALVRVALASKKVCRTVLRSRRHTRLTAET